MKKTFSWFFSTNAKSAWPLNAARASVLTSLCATIMACGPIYQGSNIGAKLADTQYVNPNGTEVEVDIEGDVEINSGKIDDAPAYVGRFALTYLEKNYQIYLESLVAEASLPWRIEWWVGDRWLQGDKAIALPHTQLRRFRIRGMNAVLLRSAVKDAVVGTRFKVKVPLNPFNVADQAGASCADPHGRDRWNATNDIYWYLWNPHLAGCKAAVQDMSVTVSRTFSTHTSYPEYGKLLGEKKITVVAMFAAISKNLPVRSDDSGFNSAGQAAELLLRSGFTAADRAPLGRRFNKLVGGINVEVDIYSPYEFAELSDEAHFANFQKALSEHQIVIFDGHSMLGSSDFWKRASYPKFYQIFLYTGCLGYQYYINSIVNNKGGWDNLDIVSSVFEVSATGVDVGAPFLKDLLRIAKGGAPASWQEILTDIRISVEAAEQGNPSSLPDTSFGVSGARDNCWSLNGSPCH